MLVNFIKFIHLLFALGVMSLTFIGLFTKDVLLIARINFFLFSLALLSLISGVFLVHPKNFTFHTPWIEAAILLIFLFCTTVLTLILFRRKIAYFSPWTIKFTYFALLGILIVVVHDAVTKISYLLF